MDENLHMDDELLVRYIDGQLNDDEKTTLEDRLSSDKELREKLDSLRTAKLAVQQFGNAQSVRSVHREMMKELSPGNQKTKVISFKRYLKYSIGVAASILIVFLAIKGFNSSPVDADEFYTENFVDYQLSGTRGNETRSAISQYYQENKFRMISLERDLASNAQDSLLVALSFMKTNEFTQAIDWLQPLTNQPLFRQDAGFYLSLALFKNGNYNEAYNLIKSIHEEKDHLYRGVFSGEELEVVERMID